MSTAKPVKITLAAELTKRINSIESRAKAVGSNMTRLCFKTGIARATVERWGYRAPQTITKVDELEAAVAELEAMTPDQLAEFNGRSAAAAASAKPPRRKLAPLEIPRPVPAAKAPAKAAAKKPAAKKAAPAKKATRNAR